jgi:hypothetical protein
MATDVDGHPGGSPMDKLDSQIAAWADKPGGALLVTAGPQSGKTTKFCYQTVPWLLADEPDLRIVVATYSHLWARELRDRIYWHAGRYGVDVQAGMIRAACVTGVMPPAPADVLIVDDPHRNDEQASSQVNRDRVWAWWQSEALCRLVPDARVLVASRRWADDDLAGRLLASEPDRWDHHDIADSRR